jgi:ribosomal protein L17
MAQGRGGRTLAPENETAQEKFKRIAAGRVSKAVIAINQLRDLAEARKIGTYEYNDEQVAKMFEALAAAYQTAEQAFRRSLEVSARGDTKQQAFTFD